MTEQTGHQVLEVTVDSSPTPLEVTDGSSSTILDITIASASTQLDVTVDSEFHPLEVTLNSFGTPLEVTLNPTYSVLEVTLDSDPVPLEVTLFGDPTVAKDFADAARGYRDEAEYFASTISGSGDVVSYAGTWNPIDGAPPIPLNVAGTEINSFYRITDAGTLHGVVLEAGDELMYDRNTETWFKVGSDKEVYSQTESDSKYAPISHNHSWGEVDDKPDEATRWPSWSEVTDKPVSFTPAAHGHDWSEISGKPTEFTPSSHNHLWSEIINRPATALRWPEWNEVTSKPTEFTPAFHTHNISGVTGLQTALDSKIDESREGVALGVAVLDANAKLESWQIPDSLLGQVDYQGTWNASTDTPTLQSPSTVKGHYYIVSVAGTYAGRNFEVGDWVISDGVVWDKVDNTDAVQSVAGRTGAVVIDWTDVENKPNTFTPSAHTHAASDINSGTFANARISQGNVTQHEGALGIGWSQLSGIPSFASRWPSWGEVTGKPSLFSGSYNDLSNVPAEFSPEDHTHFISDIVGGSVSVGSGRVISYHPGEKINDISCVASLYGFDENEYMMRFRNGGSSGTENVNTIAFTRYDSANVMTLELSMLAVAVGNPTGGLRTHGSLNAENLYVNNNAVWHAGNFDPSDYSLTSSFGSAAFLDIQTSDIDDNGEVLKNGGWGVGSDGGVGIYSGQGFADLPSRTMFFASVDSSPSDWDTANGAYPMGFQVNRSSAVQSRLAMGYGGTGALAYQVKLNGSDWSSWRKVWDNNDFDIADYLLSSNFTWNNLSGKPSTFPPSSHSHDYSQVMEYISMVGAVDNTTPYGKAVIILCPYVGGSNNNVMGRIYTQRTSGNRFTQIVDFSYSATSSGTAAENIILEYLISDQNGSSTEWKFCTFDYEGTTWAGLYYDGARYSVTEAWFSGYKKYTGTNSLLCLNTAEVTNLTELNNYGASKKVLPVPIHAAGFVGDGSELTDLEWGNINSKPSTFPPSSHNHSGVYEPAFSKNTAFNKNFGTAAGTVAEGNHTHPESQVRFFSQANTKVFSGVDPGHGPDRTIINHTGITSFEDGDKFVIEIGDVEDGHPSNYFIEFQGKEVTVAGARPAAGTLVRGSVWRFTYDAANDRFNVFIDEPSYAQIAMRLQVGSGSTVTPSEQKILHGGMLCTSDASIGGGAYTLTFSGDAKSYTSARLHTSPQDAEALGYDVQLTQNSWDSGTRTLTFQHLSDYGSGPTAELPGNTIFWDVLITFT